MTIAFTGHRPQKLGGFGKRAAARLEAFALEIVSIIRPDYAIVGMALGWDQAVASACCAIGIPYTAAIPFIGQEQCWPDASKDKYTTLLEKASYVHNLGRGLYLSDIRVRRADAV